LNSSRRKFPIFLRLETPCSPYIIGGKRMIFAMIRNTRETRAAEIALTVLPRRIFQFGLSPTGIRGAGNLAE
jgi:hypothetical protein